MHFSSRPGAVVLLVLAAFSFSCASRVRPIVRGTHPASQKLLNATKGDLIKKLADNYTSIRSFSVTVDLTPSVGSVYKGKIRDYTDLTAYIDYRTPERIRVVGLLPVVRTTAFHMVSDGTEFRAHLPLKNRFIEGRNDAPAASPNKLENIRPQTFLAAMLVRPVDPVLDLVFLSDDTTESSATYQLEIVRKVGDDLAIVRRVTFDRVNLQIIEQREYDESGGIVSRSNYAEFRIYDNVRFPSRIDITRPKDEYGIELAVMKMEINNKIDDARFRLPQPEGTELQVIGQPVPVTGKEVR